ncbi:DNA-directed RNA polymerase III subunit [Arachis hypogaea]|nr:DNA-directed RNA polymerase III subunit [Arachis hypogaea]
MDLAMYTPSCSYQTLYLLHTIDEKEITQTQTKNPSTVSLHHRRKEWHTAAVRRTQSSPSVRLSNFPRAPSLQPLFAVTDRGYFLELGVRRLCLLSRASVAVCLPFTFARRSSFAFTRRSPFEFAFVFVWKPRCSAPNSATNPRAPPSRRTALFFRRPGFSRSSLLPPSAPPQDIKASKPPLQIEHTLPLPAPQLSRPIREAIHTELEKLFLDKVIANLGLCVSVYDIKSIEGGFIYPGDGAPTYTVVFNLIMFRPFVGEIMTAKLLSSDADGLRLSLGFFDDIYVPLQHLPSPNEFKAESKNSTKGTWYWKYEEQSYPVDDSDMIKFRIQNVTYPSIPVEQPKESKPFAPMLVTGSIDHDGLGPVSWWPGQEEDAEEEEEEETAAEE